MKKGFLIYEEMLKYSPYMRRPLVMYDFATAPFWISLYTKKIFFYFFISVVFSVGIGYVWPVFGLEDEVGGLQLHLPLLEPVNKTRT